MPLTGPLFCVLSTERHHRYMTNSVTNYKCPSGYYHHEPKCESDCESCCVKNALNPNAPGTTQKRSPGPCDKIPSSEKKPFSYICTMPPELVSPFSSPIACVSSSQCGDGNTYGQATAKEVNICRTNECSKCYSQDTYWTMQRNSGLIFEISCEEHRVDIVFGISYREHRFLIV